eukprot:ctg_83.g27
MIRPPRHTHIRAACVCGVRVMMFCERWIGAPEHMGFIGIVGVRTAAAAMAEFHGRADVAGGLAPVAGQRRRPSAPPAGQRTRERQTITVCHAGFQCGCRAYQRGRDWMGAGRRGAGTVGTARRNVGRAGRPGAVLFGGASRRGEIEDVAAVAGSVAGR